MFLEGRYVLMSYSDKMLKKENRILGLVLPSSSGIPSFSTNQIPATRPGEAIFTTGSIGVGSSCTAVSPVGVVISVVGAGLAWGSTTQRQLARGRGEYPGDGRQGKEETQEGSHDDE